MKPHFLIVALALSTAISAAMPAQATDYLTGTLGWYDLIDQDNQSAQFGAEYRLEQFEYGFRPMVGISVTGDSAIYGYAGFHWDVELLPNELYLSPNFAAGLYGQGDGKDLGGAIEFRSGLELAYQMQNQHRLGVAINHISNASIYDKNPGTETVLLSYSLPLGSI